MPIWNKLPSDGYMDVRRITTRDGHSILGRIVADRDVENLQRDLGVSGGAPLAPKALIATVMAGKPTTLNGLDQLIIKRSLVNGSQRIELVGAHPSRLAWYKAKGAVTEIIAPRTRLFIPPERAEAIIAELVAAAHPAD